MSDESSNPLLELHRRDEAEFQKYADLEIVCTFGEPQAEYSALHKGAALMDLPHRGILALTGDDRLDFLNRLLTNQTFDKQNKQPLAEGSGVYAFLLNQKGRIIGDMNVLERGNQTLLETDFRLVPVLKEAMEKYIFSEKVELKNRIGLDHSIALQGPRAMEILREVMPELPELEPLASASALFLKNRITVWRDDPCGVPGYFLIVPFDEAKKLWQEFLDRFSKPDPQSVQMGKRAVWPTGWAAFNAARIEAGRPIFGIDFDDSVLPAETGQMDRAVSLTKGCYVGQEIVARMHARSQVPRCVVGIKMEIDALPFAGASIFDAEQNRIGQITSSTISPILSNAAICLGMVKKPFTVTGSELVIAAEGFMRKGHVVDLPFHLRPGKGSEPTST